MGQGAGEAAHQLGALGVGQPGAGGLEVLHRGERSLQRADLPSGDPRQRDQHQHQGREAADQGRQPLARRHRLRWRGAQREHGDQGADARQRQAGRDEGRPAAQEEAGQDDEAHGVGEGGGAQVQRPSGQEQGAVVQGEQGGGALLPAKPVPDGGEHGEGGHQAPGRGQRRAVAGVPDATRREDRGGDELAPEGPEEQGVHRPVPDVGELRCRSAEGLPLQASDLLTGAAPDEEA